MNLFDEAGCLIVRNVVDTTTYYEYAMTKLKTCTFTTDSQVPNTPAYRNDPLMITLHQKLLPFMEEQTGMKLFPTYCYYRVYKHGDVLNPHTDREACEISATLCIGYDASEPWPIFCKDKQGNTVKAILKPGDMLIYRGIELTHWREKFEGRWHVQLFLHYVDQNGKYTAHKYDRIMEAELHR